MTATKRQGFTIMELVMVIIIVAIIASVSLPKFANFKTRAIENSELSVFQSLNTAIKIKYTQNIAAGSEPENAWPTNNPFLLLAQAPPYIDVSSFSSYSNDNVNWRAGGNYLIPPWQIWFIHCPHWNGTHHYNYTYGSKGQRYIYRFGTYSTFTLWCPQQGDFTIYDNLGH